MEIALSFSQIAIVAVSCYLISVVWSRIQRYRKWVNIIRKIPHPKTVPFFGNALQLLGKREDLSANWDSLISPLFEKYPIMSIFVGPLPVVICIKAEAAKVILNSSTNITKGYYYQFFHKWAGEGLITSTGEKWHRRRKLINPTFHFRIFDNFLLSMNEQADILIELLLAKCDGKKTSDEFDIYPFVTRCALDIICETALGHKINTQKNVDSEYNKLLIKLSGGPCKRMVTPWLMPEWMYQLSADGRNANRWLNIVHGFANKIIQQRHAEMQRNGRRIQDEDDQRVGLKQRVALLDMLISHSLDDSYNGMKLSNDDIREEGHETISAAICFLLHLIAHHPEIQQKIFEELNSVLGDEVRAINRNDLPQLKYMECCIKESLRIFPPIPYISRTLSHDLEICGYDVPKGTQVTISIINVQRDPTIYPEPLKFNPDRFLPENSQFGDTFAYIPFSAGLRNCIGHRYALMEVKVVLSRIIQNFIVTSSMEPDLTKSIISEVILRPIKGIKVRLEPRKKDI